MNLTIDQIQAMLTVDKHRLDDALVVQADIMFRISDHITDHGETVTDLAEQIKQVEAAAFLEAKDAGQSDKLAEKTAKSHPGRVKLGDQLAASKRQLSRWTGLHEAWKARGYAIRELAALYAAQYFDVSPNSSRREAPARTDYSKAREVPGQRTDDPPARGGRRRIASP